ncbi:aminotransferase class V-fold PLP-dependent enzyme [Alphaproteobacteria bacterium]|nr:aminotransferase class V-fold PLP-dependent enzyme [Alphaproteobacteria bacterium]
MTVSENAPDWGTIRKLFPATRDFVYLDGANKGALPKCVEEATQDWLRIVYEEAGVGAFSMDEIERTRDAVATTFGAPSECIALIKNTSEGINILAQGIGLQPGENVILSRGEHENNTFPWRHLESRGVEIRWVEESENNIYPLETYEKLIDSNTRVVTVAWVTYGVGYRADLRALSELCHSRDALLFVDGVQGVAILNERIDELGVDALSAGGHKAMFSLAGAGFLYVRKEIIPQIDPPYAAKFSFTSNDRMKEEVELATDSHRFEYGNPNYLGTYVQRRGCEFIKSIGLNHIEDRVKELSTFLMESALQRGHTIRTPRDWHQRAGIVSMNMGKDAQAIADSLAEQKIRVSCKDGHLRSTVHFYNNEDDIVRYLDALDAI